MLAVLWVRAVLFTLALKRGILATQHNFAAYNYSVMSTSYGNKFNKCR